MTRTLDWGLASIVRDYQSEILRALAKNLSLVYEGKYEFCPDSSGRYLDCFWEELNSCQAVWHDYGHKATVRQPEQTVLAITGDDFPHWLWDKMYGSGSIHIRDAHSRELIDQVDVENEDQYLQIKIAVLRAILTKRIFKPRSFILAKTKKMVSPWRASKLFDAQKPGLVVHIRRTDKLNDHGKHWRHINFTSSRHMGNLVQQMEQSISNRFDHFFIMSDDVHMLQRAADDLKPFFVASPQPLFSKELCNVLGADASTFKGHETLGPLARGRLYVSI